MPRPSEVSSSLTIANLSAITIKAELGVPFTRVLLNPKPATWPFASIFTEYCPESPSKASALATNFASRVTPVLSPPASSSLADICEVADALELPFGNTSASIKVTTLAV